MAAYTLTLPKITAAQAQEGNFLIAKGEGENFRDKKMKFLISARLDLRITHSHFTFTEWGPEAHNIISPSLSGGPEAHTQSEGVFSV